MGLFSRKKKEIEIFNWNDLSELDLKDGEYTLPKKLWNSISSYTFKEEEDKLILVGSKYFEINDISSMFNDFYYKFGVDGHGDAGWSDNEKDDINNFGDISRDWYFDIDFNSKPAKWATENDNFSKITNQILLNCDTKEDGIEIIFVGWKKIKEQLYPPPLPHKSFHKIYS